MYAIILTALLGSSSFPEREVAFRVLSASVWLPLCERLENHHDAEVAGRAWTIVDARYLALARKGKLLPRGWTKLPWISGLALHYHEYLSAARDSACGDGPPDWPDYREATRLLLRDLAGWGWFTGHELRELVDRLGWAEERWRAANK